jgi:molybdopterin synthase sulfur carrier subunit
MSIRVLYFAGLREVLGSADETLPLPTGVSTAGALRDYLAGRGGPWAQLRSAGNLRCAVNQTMVEFTATLADGDEIAFFPPVTGG